MDKTKVNQSSSDAKMGRSISFFGLVAQGIGAMFGTSWLLLSSGWLDRAGGPWNVLLAFVLVLIIELPLAFSYLEAIGMFPLSGGELVYSYVAFGPFGGFIAAWAGILMNGIIFCWETLAIMNIATSLFPALANAPTLYEIGGSPITLPSILIGLFVAIFNIAIHLRGGSFSASVSKISTTIIIALVIIGIVVGLFQMDTANLAIPQTKPPLEGSLSLLAVLTFTIAGWETVAKSAGEARSDMGRKKAASALVVCLVVCIVLNMLVVLVTSGLMPWPEAAQGITPFADAVVAATGTPFFGKMLLFAALVGVFGVSNATLYGATRVLYSLGEVELIPSSFSKVNEKTKAPVNAILFIGLFAIATPFIGSAAFLPLVNVTAVATIVMWIMTFFAVLALRKNYPNLDRPVTMPGGKFTIYFGIFASVFILGTVLLPFSPGSIVWPGEYLLVLGLFILGVILYQSRNKTLDIETQRNKIMGDASEAM